MKKGTYLIILLFTVTACKRSPKDDGTAPFSLFPKPQIIEAKLNGGYAVNMLTGDTIQALVNTLGDTIKTGVPIPAKGRMIHPDSVAKPRMFRLPSANRLTQKNAHPNWHKVPEKLITIPIKRAQLKYVSVPKVSDGDTTHYILNTQGRKVPTGVSVPARRKVVKAIQPKPCSALPPAFKDAANENFKYLDVDQGMNSSYVSAILKDKKGNMWFGTVGGGVSMYNGESFVHYTQKEGLSNNIVFSMLEDKKGNLWFGTYGGGLTMFDGENFVHYNEKLGLSHDEVRCMLEDKKGNLWIGTSGGGVSVYNGESFVHYTIKEGLSNNNVWCMLEDKNGNLWFGTDEGGVSMYNGEATNQCREKKCNHRPGIQKDLEEHNQATSKSFVHYTLKDGLSDNAVKCIMEDKKGNLWFGTSGGGVSMLKSEPTNPCLEKRCNHNLGVHEDLVKHENYTARGFVHYTEKEGLCHNDVRCIQEDKKGNLWIGTQGGGVSMFNEDVFVCYSENEGLSNNNVNSIMEDKNGNLWIGTYGGGVSIYKEDGFVHYNEKESLPNNSVLSILEDKKGNLWFGTLGGGVSMFNAETTNPCLEKRCKHNLGVREDLLKHERATTKGYVHYTEKDGLSNNTVLSILEDKKGNLWFGTFGGGVSMFNGEGFVHFTKETGLSNNYVFSIHEDRKGNLWFGTNGGGLTMYNGESFVHYSEKEGLCDNDIRCILEDKNGNLWFGTSKGGVIKYNGKTFVHYSQKEGLSHNTVWSIVQDKKGNLWFGTHGGVSKYNGESSNLCREKKCNHHLEVQEDLKKHKQATIQSFVHYTEKEGLSHNIVRSILEDTNGNLWIATENGINKLVRSDDAAALSKPLENVGSEKIFYAEKQDDVILNFGKQDGLKGLDFFSNSVCLDSKNRIWWGAGKSLTMIDLNKFSPNVHPPAVYLKQLEINERFIDYRNVADSLVSEISFKGVSRFENYPLNPVLSYDNNHLTFHFVGIDWTASHKIKYSYRMLGLKDNWSLPSKEAKADYRNLSYGTYTFQIRAMGVSQRWSKPFNYTFTIRPPWWRTWWAYSIYFITLVGSVWYYIKWRERALKQRQIELEHTVALRTAEVVEEKNRSEELLLNILPREVAEELKYKGEAEARQIDEVTVLFTDFKGFTSLSEKLSPKELVQEIHACFSAFDIIMQKHGVEKIKTIGDAYMAAGGLPVPNKSHAGDVVSAALEIQKYMEQHKIEKQASGELFFEIRIGVHTGPVVAGIVGVKKFAYDIWGDTVNTASRMESSGEVGKVNISGATYEKVKDQFLFIPRGKIQAKGKGEVDMYFVLEKTIL